MDPISVVIAALAAGAIAATKETAGTAVKDAYQGLKGLIKKKFAGETKAEMVLEEHATDPETYEAPLKKKLAEAGIDRDEEIIQAAQELLKQENPEESAAGKYNVVFQGEVKGMQMGDRNTQTNTFS
ncbi:MAG: hypothetical protein HC916_17010 [Coleofasciculaceae cyanobacterium SM2_1_6]|nr:hypothetical protein [Coleofasciculaceae cyanobacterium SM2_1_6]